METITCYNCYFWLEGGRLRLTEPYQNLNDARQYLMHYCYIQNYWCFKFNCDLLVTFPDWIHWPMAHTNSYVCSRDCSVAKSIWHVILSLCQFVCSSTHDSPYFRSASNCFSNSYFEYNLSSRLHSYRLFENFVEVHFPDYYSLREDFLFSQLPLSKQPTLRNWFHPVDENSVGLNFI